MKRLASGVLIGLLLVALFSAPWIYQQRQAWAVGSCAVFRTWNTGDTMTAADLNSSFTTAAVTNSTPQCLDDFSATVSQMQSTADPFASGAESQATSTAGEIERLRFMFKQIFGFTQWYRHDQAPMFAASHIGISALHLGSSGVPGGTDTQQNAFLARFPVLTGPDHWTGIWWPHNTTHMAISIADYNHAQGGVQGGIELFRFHARGVIFHHTVALMFKHSESRMHGGQRGHVTALSIDPTTDQLLLGHPGATMRIQGNGITGGAGQSLQVAADGRLSTAAASAVGLFGSRGQYSFTPGPSGQNTFTLAAHSISLMNASTHTVTVIANPPAVTVDISTSGPAANGRDRAGALSASSWAHFYWIYNGTTLAGIVSPVGPTGGPNLTGTGYTSWTYAGPVRLDGDTDLVGTHILGSFARYTQHVSALLGGTSESPVHIDLSNYAPPQAIGTLVEGLLRVTENVAAQNPKTGISRADIHAASSFAVVTGWNCGSQSYGTTNTEMDCSYLFELPGVTLYYVLSQRVTTPNGSTRELNLTIRGYRIPNGAQ